MMTTTRPGSVTRLLAGLIAATFLNSACFAQDDGADEEVVPRSDEGMTVERLGELVLRVDEEATRNGNGWIFMLEGLDTMIVYDTSADRMRILIPIGEAEDFDAAHLLRLMQANFDSALDARYAIAQGVLWGTYIHPLSTLTDEEFLVGLGQTANVVITYGGTYSSGMFIFGGGDSAEIERRKLIDRLREQRT